MFWSKCLDGVFISVFVAHKLHVEFCTINAPSRHCVFIVFWLSVLVLSFFHMGILNFFYFMDIQNFCHFHFLLVRYVPIDSKNF